MAAPPQAVHRLTDRQARLARVGAAAAAFGFVALWAPQYPDPAALGFTGVGLLAAGLLLYGARRDSVVLTALGAFLVAMGPWGFVWVVGAPYFLGAVLLLVRASKEAAAARPRAAHSTKPAKPEPKPDPVPVERRPPGESKRYTPPAARKKRR